MNQRDRNLRLTLVRTLRELDTTGEHKAICDAEELEVRRQWMDEPMITIGGISWRAYNLVQMELVRSWPDIYFSLIRAYRPRGFRDYSSPRVRELVWAESAEQAKKDLPIRTRRWLRRKRAER